MEISLGAQRSDRSFCVRPSLSPCCGNHPWRQRFPRGSGIFAAPQFPTFSTISANTGHSAAARRMGPVDTQRTSFDCGVSALERFARQRGRFSRSPSRGSPAIFQVKEGFLTRRPAKIVCSCRAGTDYVRQPRPGTVRQAPRGALSAAEQRHARGLRISSSALQKRSSNRQSRA
jgi:hypothetical protein